MVHGPIYYPEDILVEKHQSGEFTWVDYISHFSEQWCEEYEHYCAKNHLNENDDFVAEAFVSKKTEELEAALENGDA